MSMSWLVLTILVVQLSSCSWLLAGGKTCSLSGAHFFVQTVTVSAAREDGSTPGARVSWSTTVPQECVTSVRVEFRTSISWSVVRSYTTTNTSETEVIQTGLQCATTYYIRVRVTGVPSLGTLTSQMKLLIVGGIPAPVRVRAEVTADNTSIRVSWKWSRQGVIMCLESVRVDYQPEGGSLMMYTVNNTTALSATLSNLQCNKLYTISVIAKGGSTGSRSLIRVISLPARASPTPTEVTVQVMNASSVRVTWQWTSSGPAPSCFNTTRVTYHPEGGRKSSLQLRDPAATETILTDLQCNTCYTITVLATAGGYRRESVAMAVLPLVLQGPQNLSAAVLSSTSVYLTWVAPCDTQQYHIYYRGTCGTYVDEGSVDTSHTEYTFDELQEGVNYTFTVNQTGFGGCGVFSTVPVYAMTFTAVPSGAPQLLQVTFLQLSEVSFSWREVPCVQQNGPITGYVVRYYATCGPDRDVQQTKSVVTTGSIIDGLTPNTEYAFQVAAVNTNGTGPFSEAITLGGAPRLVMVSPVNSTTVTVSWSEVQCFNGSGAVTHHLVQYQSMCGGAVQNVTTDGPNGIAQTISNLTPSTAVYIFQVAVVATDQMIGPFSNPVNVAVSDTSPMCSEGSDGLSSSTDLGARPSTHPGVTDPESRSCTDPGLLAGVAVIVTVLVTAAACIVVLIIWWRYTRIKNQPHSTYSTPTEHSERITGIPMKECLAYKMIDQSGGMPVETHIYEEVD